MRVIPDADFQAVTPDAKTKTHFVIVDCVGVMEDPKTEPPLDRERGVSFGRLIELVQAGNRDEEVLAALAARLDRMDRRLTADQRRTIESASGGASVRDLVAGILDRLDPDAEDARARDLAGLPPEARPDEAQVAAAQAALREEAAAPIAYAPALCEALRTVRQAQEVTIDVVTLDEVRRSGFRPDLTPDHDAARALVSEFEAFCASHRDEIAALTVLYSRPYALRLTRKQLMELVAAIERPPRQWTSEALWAAYERVEQGRVRGASGGRVLTDLISLARHAMGLDPQLVSYAEQAAPRFERWLAQQANRGRSFNDEQLTWLRLIRDRIIADFEVRLEDFDDIPFADRGGLGRVWSLFGDDLEEIVEDLHRELVA